MEVWPDLFGRALLLRQWGRIGTEGRRWLDPHSDTGAAINALARLPPRRLAVGVLVLESLDKRRSGLCRAVPVPPVCSRRSTWCTASASCRAAVGRAGASALRPWRGG
jgi:hypothetical protein